VSRTFVDSKIVTNEEFEMAAMFYNRLTMSGITDPADKIRWARKEIERRKKGGSL